MLKVRIKIKLKIVNEKEEKIKKIIKIERYNGKFSLFKTNFDGKIKDRLNFLKEKVFKSMFEIRNIFKTLFFNKLGLPQNDKKIFNVLKTKKSRENIQFEDDNQEPHKNNERKKNYKEFFEYKNNSSSSENSENNSDQEDLCKKLDDTDINKEIFNEVFPPRFVTLNQYKECESELFEDEIFPLENYSKNLNLTTKDSNLKDNVNKDIQINNVYANLEIEKISEIFEEIKKYNKDFVDQKEFSLGN